MIEGADSIQLNKPGAIDLVFSGDYGAYFAWLAFCFEVNYRDFFVGALARFGIRRKAAETPEP
jgi:hypothetical protein